jgi:hypothetical protein
MQLYIKCQYLKWFIIAFLSFLLHINAILSTINKYIFASTVFGTAFRCRANKALFAIVARDYSGSLIDQAVNMINGRNFNLKFMLFR